jgi:Rrf2 family protein
MIQINRKTDYAVRIILALSKLPPGTRKSTSEIRDKMQIPSALSQRIVADLARGNFIQTFPGRDGGIQLARPANQINLLQIIEFIQEPIYVSDCLISSEATCAFSGVCPVRNRWAKLRKLIRTELESQTFDQLAHDATELENLTLS